jgi:CheY-like chemotaxis protein
MCPEQGAVTDRQAIGRPMEILLVEDGLLDARLTMEALRKGGLQHRLTLIRDGEEALDFLLHHERFAQAPRPDLILLDLLLPKKSGLEVLAVLKAQDHLKDIPVVIMTASEDEQTRLECEAQHVEHYLRKPVNYDDFLAIMRKLKHHWHHDLLLPPLE